MSDAAFRHYALFYSDDAEYADGVGGFIAEGLLSDEPVMVSVPREKHGLLRERLGAAADCVRFEDMRRLGHNPWRIIPTVRRWADERAGGPVRFVGEPIWPGRSEAALEEATRHESLINLAFADCDAAILCPYDATALDPGVLADAEHTHPTFLSCDGTESPSERYSGLELAMAPEGLPEPPPDAAVFEITDDVAALRRELRELAVAGGVAERRVDDLLIAATEAATNTLLHAPAPGRATVWTENGHVICDVRSRGEIPDPLAGRRHPGPNSPDGRGMWLVNQVCDLVELRLGPPEAVLRLHVSLW